VQDVMGIAPLDDKWRAFGWHVIDCKGHDMADILKAFAAARAHSGSPVVILAHTVMGQGVSYMADDYRWHGKPPKMEEAEKALKEMGTSYAEWSERLLAH
jgi:transketolase